MKLYLALMLLSTAAIAETKSVTAMFSFTDTEKSFETVFPEGQTVKLEYIVTEQQKSEAYEERKRVKSDKIKNMGNKLVFVGMGMNYKPRYEDDVCKKSKVLILLYY